MRRSSSASSSESTCVSNAAAELSARAAAFVAGRLRRGGLWLGLALAACAAPARPPSAAPPPAPSERERADAFVREVDAELRRLTVAASLAEWDKSTNITDENEQRAAQ